MKELRCIDFPRLLVCYYPLQLETKKPEMVPVTAETLEVAITQIFNELQGVARREARGDRRFKLYLIDLKQI